MARWGGVVMFAVGVWPALGVERGEDLVFAEKP
jgi:hypothetical protein